MGSNQNFRYKLTTSKIKCATGEIQDLSKEKIILIIAVFPTFLFLFSFILSQLHNNKSNAPIL